ncbi:hypothetical protein JHD48_10275 [Sulfurimonas sp. SAG-AH-194-I05]|nr:hypothetical protein [Sulfurimonas sp. SAG-AH-194-I05]MDF1876118.1 hypothetical protein [Sulfurimonas sp. SAG-AH-194-I05]
MKFIEIFLSFWWLIPLFVILPYIYYYVLEFAAFLKAKKKKEVQFKRVRQSVEKKELGIEIENKDPVEYQKRIEKLIFDLNESKSKLQVNAVEAIMIIELFSDSVKINEKDS